MSTMVNGKERAAQLERLAPKPSAREVEAVNGLFRHFLFKRCGKGEIWTTCCRRHTFIKPDTDNACELRILDAPHAPEPRSTYDNSPEHKRRETCPYCGAEVTVKELRYSGGRANLWSFRRAVILRQWRGTLWATAWECEKNYSRADMNGEPVLTELPEMKLLGVYRFAPGVAEQATRQWWYNNKTPMSYRRQTAPGKSNGRKGGIWQIHSPYSYCAELGSSYDVIGLTEPDKGFMRWCGIGKIHLPSDDFIELLTACCFYPRQIEMLVKLGLEDAVKDLVGRGVRNADIIKWDADKPRDFMKCTPKEAMAACSTGEPLQVLRLYIRHRDTPLKMTIETAAWIAEATIGRSEENYAVRLLKRLGITAEKLTAYLEKNRIALQEGGRPGSGTRRGVLQLYKDYLDAAENCGMDMENPLILMPRDLVEKHDQVTAAWSAIQCQHRKAGAAAAYRKRLRALSKKYLFWTDDFLIRAPVDADEIVDEGKALKHCVGGYADRHMNGATTILFLRRRDKPHTSLATIEMNGNRIMQVHGYRNELEGCADNPERMPARQLYAGILDQWMDWLKAGSKREKDGRPKLPKKRARRSAA